MAPHTETITAGYLVALPLTLEHSPLPSKETRAGDYRPVQDLREVNRRTGDIHPTVPNPYNLLSALPPSVLWYTVLDLKDTFFCLKLSLES